MRHSRKGFNRMRMGATDPTAAAKVGPNLRDQLKALQAALPNPTNAQALAACEALPEPAGAVAGINAGLSPDIAQSYLMTLGVLPRMRLLACGWVNPGDSLRNPLDAAWWLAPYGRPLWEPLATYAAAVDRAPISGPFAWNARLATGDADELSHSIASVSDQLRLIHGAGHDVCAPFVIPRAEGVLPQPSVVCLNRLGVAPAAANGPIVAPPPVEAAKKKDENTALRLGLVLAGIYVLAYHYKHGRLPWRT